MANIGVELKRLLTKLGGTPSKYDQTNELIHKITDQVESGGGGGIVVNLSESGALDKTWKEIRDAFVSGAVCVAVDDEYKDIHGFYSVNMVYQDSRYNVADSYGNLYTADSETGYPALP